MHFDGSDDADVVDDQIKCLCFVKYVFAKWT